MTASKRQEKQIGRELAACGTALRDINVQAKDGRLVLCAVRGLLVFFAAFGTIGGIASAFDLEASYIKAGLWLFVISMLISLIYFNRISFYLGYILLLGAFFAASVYFYIYINSGFQAFVNILGKRYNEYFHINRIREAAEMYGDRYVTLTAVMIFVGALLVLLLNIAISGYMSLILTFLITFLPLQIAFYIDLIPKLQYLIMLLGVYISVTVLGRAGNFTLPYRHEKGKTYLHYRKAGKVRSFYISTWIGMLQVAGYALALSFVFMLVFNGVIREKADTEHIESSAKAVTDRYVKAIVQGGITSLFNRYDAIAGIAHGQIGGIGSVNPDFETDLVIRFVPFGTDSVYLKNYTGVYYDGSRFRSERTGDSFSQYLEKDDYIPALAGEGLPQAPGENAEKTDESGKAKTETNAKGEQRLYYEQMTEQAGWDSVGKMWIGNVGAGVSRDFLPYFGFYSTSKKSLAAQGIPDPFYRFAMENIGMPAGHDENPARKLLESSIPDTPDETGMRESYEMLFLPYRPGAFYPQNPTVTADYEDYVYEEYLDIPDPLKEITGKIARDTGIADLARQYRSLYEKKHRALEKEGLLYYNGLLYDASDIAEITGETDIPDIPDISSIRDSIYVSAYMPLEQSMMDRYEYEDYEALQSLRLQIAAKLKGYFMREYTYTMSPGRTPAGRETVEYFLNDLKRGYCVHFAAASCMILRSIGIPARYAEGYVCSYESMAEGTALDEDTSNWKLGSYGISDDMPVIEVELTDASAHAWIEIYLDGYGWIPYEMTPPSDEVTYGGGGFAGFLAGLITRSRDRSLPQTDYEQPEEQLSNRDAGRVKTENGFMYTVSFILIPLFRLALITLLAFALAPLGVWAVSRIRIRQLEKKEEYAQALVEGYRAFLKNGWIRKQFRGGHPMVRDVFDLMKLKAKSDGNGTPLSEEQLVSLEEGIQRAAYSGEPMETDEYAGYKSLLKQLVSSREKL
ncbi:MAG: transglutaminase domain-containing protein [Lachnospiraceae bacterium]|nr:transglutaminase domain-containing protein [Lachnospiraceae bacterium]